MCAYNKRALIGSWDTHVGDYHVCYSLQSRGNDMRGNHKWLHNLYAQISCGGCGTDLTYPWQILMWLSRPSVGAWSSESGGSGAFAARGWDVYLTFDNYVASWNGQHIFEYLNKCSRNSHVISRADVLNAVVEWINRKPDSSNLLLLVLFGARSHQ